MVGMIVLACVGALAFVLLTQILWAKTQPKKSTTIIVAGSIVLVLVLLLLSATGRLHPIAAFVAGVFPFLRRILGFIGFSPVASMISRFFRKNMASPIGGAADGPTETATGELRMTLDHRTGEIDGTVLHGQFATRQLSSLNEAELVALYSELAEDDSKRLFESYAAKYHPNLFESASHADGRSGDRESMTVSKAREVLGLDENPDRESIISAHRRLMQHLHPDRGGSSYLAAELNEAKKILLEQLK